MSEGGIYPWKLQKIHQPKNGLPGTCRFADLSNPLPDPPKGQMWVQDESSREWQLVPVVNAATVTTADVAPSPPSSKKGGVVACTTIPVTVPSARAVVGPTPAAAAGVRYHEVLPTDTFQGICLRYKVTPNELRRANGMLVGSNLKLAPNPERLIIPSNEKNRGLEACGKSTKEEKIASLLSKLPHATENKLSYSEARAYLEIEDWDVDRAVEVVNEDFTWSS